MSTDEKTPLRVLYTMDTVVFIIVAYSDSDYNFDYNSSLEWIHTINSRRLRKWYKQYHSLLSRSYIFLFHIQHR